MDLYKLLKSQGEQLTSMNTRISTIEGEFRKLEQVSTKVNNIKTRMLSLKEENKEIRS